MWQNFDFRAISTEVMADKHLPLSWLSCNELSWELIWNRLSNQINVTIKSSMYWQICRGWVEHAQCNIHQRYSLKIKYDHHSNKIIRSGVLDRLTVNGNPDHRSAAAQPLYRICMTDVPTSTLFLQYQTNTNNFLKHVSSIWGGCQIESSGLGKEFQDIWGRCNYVNTAETSYWGSSRTSSNRSLRTQEMHGATWNDIDYQQACSEGYGQHNSAGLPYTRWLLCLQALWKWNVRWFHDP